MSNATTTSTAVVTNAFLDAVPGPANIPRMKFIEDVTNVLENHSVEEALAILHELLSKYKYMEQSLTASRRSLQGKLPDITAALEAVTFLMKRKEEKTGNFTAHFQLSDNVSATAEVPETESVMLWLGANTLLEFPLDEARALLENNKENALKLIKDLGESLEFLRCQLTTTEVNIARTHNYGVSLRQKNKTNEKL